jgi:hypothetical protein
MADVSKNSQTRGATRAAGYHWSAGNHNMLRLVVGLTIRIDCDESLTGTHCGQQNFEERGVKPVRFIPLDMLIQQRPTRVLGFVFANNRGRIPSRPSAKK